MLKELSYILTREEFYKKKLMFESSPNFSRLILSKEEFEEENDAFIYMSEKIIPYLCIVEIQGGVADEKYVGEKATLIIKDYD